MIRSNIVILIGLAAIAGGCSSSPVPHDGGLGGSGGSGSSSSSTSTSSGDGGPACVDPATSCPSTGTACIQATCVNDACSTVNVAAGADCTADGGAGKVCDGDGACVECIDAAAHCAAPPSECVVATCTAGVCGTANVPLGTPTAGGQVAGDCLVQVCDGNGSTQQDNDDNDPEDDLNDCTMDACNLGLNEHVAVAGTCAQDNGSVCGDPAGPKAGSCIGCNTDADCSAPEVCHPMGNSICVPLSFNGCDDGTDCSICLDQNACFACCDTGHPQGNYFLIGALIQHCICDVGALCSAACMESGMPSPVCADQNAPATQACYDCVNGLPSSEPCIQATITDCVADQGCSALLGCYQGC